MMNETKKEETSSSDMTFKMTHNKVMKERLLHIFEEKKKERLKEGKKLSIYSLRNELEEAYNKQGISMGISKATFYNTFNKDLDYIDPYVVMMVCHHLKVDTSFIFQPDRPAILMPEVSKLTELNGSSKTLLLDDSYRGKYYGYMYSPNMDKKHDIVEFVLELDIHGTSSEAALTFLNTDSEKKQFFGQPILFGRSDTIVIFFTNEDGNFYIFTFGYVPYNEKKMYYRKGSAITASPSDKCQILQNFVLLDHKPSNLHDRDILEGLLRVSKDKYYISKKALMELSEDPKVREFFETFSFMFANELQEVYEIEEQSILMSLDREKFEDVNRDDLVYAFAKMRSHSLSPEKIPYAESKAYAKFAQAFYQKTK
ncbi:MAG: hypothetical protein J6S14_18795 [Clostridia bacterium]|nr:hypothetical protein [Clostridia bacterium]